MMKNKIKRRGVIGKQVPLLDGIFFLFLLLNSFIDLYAKNVIVFSLITQTAGDIFVAML